MTTQDQASAGPSQRPPPWAAFVPAHVAAALRRDPGDAGVGRRHRFEAAVLFVDVSGFTPMSEQLGRHGGAGTEELTVILNRYFGLMIEVVESFGGDVAKFGGDSMTVLFPHTTRDRRAVLRRAIQCALDLQGISARHEAISTRAGDFTLSIKEGIATGPVLATIVGDASNRLDYVVAGRVLDDAAAAQRRAGRGELLIDRHVLTAIPGAEIVEERDGLVRIASLEPRAPRARRRSATSGAAAPVPATFVHPAIAAVFAAGHTSLLSEHRYVATLFVSFDAPDYDHDADAASFLQAYFSEVIHTVERYGGHFAQTDMGDKGSKYLVLFGAPVAHEDDATRALLCALELRALGGHIRAGVNSGLVFCGPIGSSTRREYAVIGDSVNVSARLMELAAPEEILVGSTTKVGARDIFDVQAKGDVAVKGRTDLVAIYALRDKYHGPADRVRARDSPFVGRRAELDRALTEIKAAAAGRGRVLALAGEAGIGKTRLCAEIKDAADDLGFAILEGACQSYATKSGYLAWQAVWKQFFGIDGEMPPEARVSRIQSRLRDADPRLSSRLPLLAPVVDMTIADNDTTGSLDAEARSQSLQDMLLRCLERSAAVRPLLIVLEDCHWIDPVSQDLLNFLGRNVIDVPLVLLVTYRWPPNGRDPLRALRGWPLTTEVTLTELESAEASTLVAAKLDELFGVDLAAVPELAEQVMERGQGNPFYIEELLSFVHAEGIDPREQPAPPVQLPLSLHGLMMARLDQLQEGQRIALKVASVIGRTFKAGWVWGSYPPAGSPPVVEANLRGLERASLTALHAEKPELEYRFRHAIAHDVTYNCLTFAQRGRLHEHIAEFIERTYPSDLDGHVDILVHHFSHTQNKAKQSHWFRRAADRARAMYNNDAALDLYQRLLPLLDDSERGEIMRRLGEVWQQVGEWENAARVYRGALALALSRGDDAGAAEARCALGYLMTFTGTYDDALVLLDDATSGFEMLRADEGLGRALEYSSHAYFFLGQYGRALEFAGRRLEIARRLGDDRGASDALENMGRANWHRGHHDAGLKCLHEALDAAAKVGYDRGLVHACNDIAGLYSELGNNERALVYLHQAVEVANRTGYRLLLAMCTGNAGILYREHGDYERSFECLIYWVQTSIEMGHRPGMANGLTELAMLRTEQKRLGEAERLFTVAIRLARDLGSPHFLCFCLYYYADMLVTQQRYPEAQPAATEALDIAIDAEDNEVRLSAEVLVTRLEMALGRMSNRVAAQRLRAMLVPLRQPQERAAVLYGLWRDGADASSGREAAALYGELFESTGKVFYARRYEELTGRALPDPPPLPPLPETLTAHRTSTLDDLLDRVELVWSR